MDRKKFLAERQWIRSQLANVADYVLLQHNQVQFMSITQLADECGTAEATISRFCRRLSLKGFNPFKIELAKHSVAPPTEKSAEHPVAVLRRLPSWPAWCCAAAPTRGPSSSALYRPEQPS